MKTFTIIFYIITLDLGHPVLKIFMNQPIYIKVSIFVSFCSLIMAKTKNKEKIPK